MTESAAPLITTPLHALHIAKGARMVPFAGYEMPVQYPDGIMKEHVHTRSAAGLFDVSHMGQVEIRAGDGLGPAVLALALEALVPVDLVELPEGRQRYAVFTNDEGGILDDLMIANLGDRLLLVVNASRKAEDVAHLEARLPDTVEVAVLDRALVALQGPKAAEALARLAPQVTDMRFMDVREVEILGSPCVVSRSGYTGEDGFEIGVPNDTVAALADALLAMDEVAPVGLGARDSLRLEAGMPLYGADLDEVTTPVAAGLAWSISKARRGGGTRAGGFPGSDVILRELADGTDERRVGLLPEGKAPVRGGALIYAGEGAAEAAIGRVTSGGFAPSLGKPVAMGYVAASSAAPGTRLYADVRGKRLPIEVSQLPFIEPSYKRT